MTTSQSLAQIRYLPPIEVTFKDSAKWYNFHEERVFNLNKKFKLFQAQEDALLEAWKLNKVLASATIELQTKNKELEILKDSVFSKSTEQINKINELQEFSIICTNKYNSQLEYTKTLEKSLRKSRNTFIGIGGVSLATILYLLLK